MDKYIRALALFGFKVPKDRIVDGVDQLDFFLEKQEKSKSTAKTLDQANGAGLRACFTH